MIRYASGDMFNEPADVRINTVNCVGVMGAGVALAFKTRYPDMFRDYQKACKNGEVKPGHLNTWKTLLGEWVVNFPTKRHWREPSRYEDIEAGLIALKAFLGKLGQVRVTLPALGCGHGGLEWSRVSEMIERTLSDLEAEIIVFSPQSSRDAAEFVQPTANVEEDKLKSLGVSVLKPGDPGYPAALTGRSAATLFIKGKQNSLSDPILAVILSNKPDEREIKAASDCLDSVLDSSMTVMFNYGTSERALIRKVLENDARVILWLAEGISNFSVRKDLQSVWDEARVTILSVCKPRERWNPTAAFRVKDLQLTFARVSLLSDPEPLWLAKLLKSHQPASLSKIFYIRYAEVNEKLREIYRAAHANPIGKSSSTGKPNVQGVLNCFYKELMVAEPVEKYQMLSGQER